MIILNSKKAEKIFRLKQFVKYAFLSIFILSAFFFLGFVLFEINHDNETAFSENLPQDIISSQQTFVSEVEDSKHDIVEDQHLIEEQKNIPQNTEQNFSHIETLPLSPEEKKQVAVAMDAFNQTLAQLDKEYLDNLRKKQEQSKIWHNKEVDITADMPQEELDKLYEEELPNNIIDDNEDKISSEQLSKGYHIYNRKKNVKDFNIIPKYKPAYFGDKAVIAVVIDDMGIAKKRTSDIISLKAPLTAAFLTYGAQLEQQIQNAKNAGMEIMLHAPMEPYSKVDVAPDMLTVKMDDKQIQEKLKNMIEKFDNIKGINNHMGSKFTENKEKMAAVMQVLKEKDLFFLDSKTTPQSVGKEMAQKYGVSYATRHVFIDNKNQKDYILKQLSIAERIAKKNGYAVAIGHPKSETYLALREWIPSLANKNIKIIPLSQIAKVLRQSHI